jgi:hypothetical protein
MHGQHVFTITTSRKKVSFAARNDENGQEDSRNVKNEKGDGGGIVDAVIITEGTERRNTNNNLTVTNQVTLLSNTIEGQTSVLQLFMDWWKKILQSLAALSLEDYKIRSSIIKERAAGRQLEESIARIRGENPGYVRPMYADETTIGPLVCRKLSSYGCKSIPFFVVLSITNGLITSILFIFSFPMHFLSTGTVTVTTYRE